MPHPRKISPPGPDSYAPQSPILEADMPVDAVKAAERTDPISESLPMDWLVLAARLLILGSRDGDSHEISSAASREILRRIKEADTFQISPREVILSLLKPALEVQGHCKCPSCRDRCFVCRDAFSRRSHLKDAEAQDS